MISLHSKHINKKRKIGDGAAINIWSKKLICKCGSSYNRRRYDISDGQTTYCYQCYHQKNTGSTKVREKQEVDLDGACDMPIIQEWKLSLIANNLIYRMCTDKERLIQIANKLIDTFVVEDNDNDDGELNIIENKIKNEKEKLSKLLDMYLSDMISSPDYTIKKKEIDETIKSYENRKIEILSGTNKPENNLKNKITELKKLINKDFGNKNSSISDKLIDDLIKQVEVEDDRFIVKLNCSTHEDEENTLIRKFIIDKDDLKEFERKNPIYKRLRMKEPIIVDICI